jgi:hypothetical protein
MVEGGGWVGNDPHNIKTFIEAEEWEVVKCLLPVVNSFYVQHARLRAAYTKIQVRKEAV